MKASYYGTCLVNGNHTPGSDAWRECPHRNAAARSERSRKAAQTRRSLQEPGLSGPVAGPEIPAQRIASPATELPPYIAR
jgi:hypothetical protein